MSFQNVLSGLDFIFPLKRMLSPITNLYRSLHSKQVFAKSNGHYNKRPLKWNASSLLRRCVVHKYSLYEHKLCGYSRRHLCPRALAAGGKEGSLQTSDQYRTPKQCLFWYLIPDALDQKWREAPLSSSQINNWNSLPAEVGQTPQVIHVTFMYGNFFLPASVNLKVLIELRSV